VGQCCEKIHKVDQLKSTKIIIKCVSLNRQFLLEKINKFCNLTLTNSHQKDSYDQYVGLQRQIGDVIGIAVIYPNRYITNVCFVTHKFVALSYTALSHI
jgi:hypothetical protein